MIHFFIGIIVGLSISLLILFIWACCRAASIADECMNVDLDRYCEDFNQDLTNKNKNK